MGSREEWCPWLQLSSYQSTVLGFMKMKRFPYFPISPSVQPAQVKQHVCQELQLENVCHVGNDRVW